MKTEKEIREENKNISQLINKILDNLKKKWKKFSFFINKI